MKLELHGGVVREIDSDEALHRWLCRLNPDTLCSLTFRAEDGSSLYVRHCGCGFTIDYIDPNTKEQTYCRANLDLEKTEAILKRFMAEDAAWKSGFTWKRSRPLVSLIVAGLTAAVFIWILMQTSKDLGPFLRKFWNHFTAH